MSDKKEDTKTTIVESAAKGGMSAAMPYVVVIGGGVIAYKYLKDDAANLIVGGGGRVIERTSEIVNNTIDTISTSTTEILDSGKQFNDEMNDNYITNLFAPDIQRKEDMMDAQKWSLSEYKKGNVNFHTISGGKLDKNASIFDIVKNAWSKETLANTQIMFLPKGKDKPLAFLAPDSVTTINSIDVGSIKTPSQARKAGLHNAPLAINKGPKQNVFKFKLGSESPLAQSKKEKSSSNEIGQVSNNANTNTSKVKVKKIKSSGMPTSNLKNASSVSTVTDKSGKERVVVKYKNGVTLRY